MNGEETCWIEVLNGDWAGPLKLHVRGRSMWPTLRPDDQVTVEPTTTHDLKTGDWVLLQGQDTLFLHRFLGFTRQGLLLTKGDGHCAPDSPWPPDALRGRAVAISRHGKTTPISSSSLRERMRTFAHRLMATTWSLLRRCVHRTGLLAFLLLCIPVTTVLAAVTLTSFTATPQEDSILIEWETASEVDMSVFYVQRAPYVTPEIADCADIPGLARISDFIPSEGDIVGASYDYTDTSAEVGVTYYYCLEAVEAGGDFELHGPITAAIQPAATTEPTQRPPTSTPTPAPTPSATPPSAPPRSPSTATSTPTSTPKPTSTPATGTPPTATPTRTPTRTPVASSGENTPTKTLPPTATQTPAAGSPTAAVAPTFEPAVATSGATATPHSDLASQPTRSPAPVAQVTAISSTTDGRPSPSPSPDSSGILPTRSTANSKGSPLSWGVVLALIIAAGVLILLGGLGLWWMRQQK